MWNILYKAAHTNLYCVGTVVVAILDRFVVRDVGFTLSGILLKRVVTSPDTNLDQPMRCLSGRCSESSRWEAQKKSLSSRS